MLNDKNRRVVELLNLACSFAFRVFPLCFAIGCVQILLKIDLVSMLNLPFSNAFNDPIVHNAFEYSIIFALEIICLGYIREFVKKKLPWWMWLLLLIISVGLQYFGRYLAQQLTGYDQWVLAGTSKYVR